MQQNFNIKLGGIMIDCEDPQSLASFYARLLGWDIGEKYGYAMIRKSGENVRIFFQREIHYMPPTWPAMQGKQQMMQHLDFEVNDLQASVDYAISLGAKKAKTQNAPKHYITMLDPEGHPFCLCV
ncbi:glyoxalase/bleomycin resistance/dioxygenase family protein [Clostridia bacterium]|nr:glyoxalase/bleomycin resistance/dioxygenase family protein [Clostridia bacterium]